MQLMNTRDLLLGIGIGSAVAFILDPNGGARRRALVRDKMTSATRKTREGLDATARDLSNRVRGVAAEVRGSVWSDRADDQTLEERVRAKLGRVCSHPRAITVEAHDGAVTLRGPILAREVERVLDTAAGVRGVRNVNDELDSHESADGIPALQGEGRVADDDVTPRQWAPATRALVSAGVLATGVWVASYARRDH
jgi:gas vesicle protein